MDEDFQDQFSKMEIVSNPHVMLDMKLIYLTSIQDGSVHCRSVEQLRQELDVQRANLDMITQTNPGVVEQYERRKNEVCLLQL